MPLDASLGFAIAEIARGRRSDRVHGVAHFQGDELIVEGSMTVGPAQGWVLRYVWPLPHSCGKSNGTITCIKGCGKPTPGPGTFEPMASK